VHARGPKKELVKQCSCHGPEVRDIFAYHTHVSGRPFLSLLIADGDWSCSSNLYLNFNFKNYRCTSPNSERIKNCQVCSTVQHVSTAFRATPRNGAVKCAVTETLRSCRTIGAVPLHLHTKCLQKAIGAASLLFH